MKEEGEGGGGGIATGSKECVAEMVNLVKRGRSGSERLRE